MSCPGDVFGHDGGMALLPAVSPQANVARDAALDATERNMRMTQVLTVDAPATHLPTRVVVPASLRRVSARDADTVDGAGLVVRDE